MRYLFLAGAFLLLLIVACGVDQPTNLERTADPALKAGLDKDKLVEEETPMIWPYFPQPQVLWSPNGKMNDISIVDTKGNPIQFKVTYVEVNEDYDPSDIGMSKETPLQLRATRNDDGIGRAYKVYFEVIGQKMDQKKRDRKRSVTVIVPHDQGKKMGQDCPCWTSEEINAIDWLDINYHSNDKAPEEKALMSYGVDPPDAKAASVIKQYGHYTFCHNIFTEPFPGIFIQISEEEALGCQSMIISAVTQDSKSSPNKGKQVEEEIPMAWPYRPQPQALWPPNGEMIDVTIVDSRGKSIPFEVTGIDVSEDHDPSDIWWSKDALPQLRATRNDDGIGRAYRIFFVRTDNQEKFSVTVIVPHDLGKRMGQDCPCWTSEEINAVDWVDVSLAADSKGSGLASYGAYPSMDKAVSVIKTDPEDLKDSKYPKGNYCHNVFDGWLIEENLSEEVALECQSMIMSALAQDLLK